MRKFFSKLIRFRSEPHSMSCPKCGALMSWYPGQGPLGGWRCPKDGLQIDYK